MDIKAKRTDSGNEDFQMLVEILDEELAVRDGEHQLYHQFNSIDHLETCIILCKDENPVGIGAIKSYMIWHWK